MRKQVGLWGRWLESVGCGNWYYSWTMLRAGSLISIALESVCYWPFVLSISGTTPINFICKCTQVAPQSMIVGNIELKNSCNGSTDVIMRLEWIEILMLVPHQKDRQDEGSKNKAPNLGGLFILLSGMSVLEQVPCHDVCHSARHASAVWCPSSFSQLHWCLKTLVSTWQPDTPWYRVLQQYKTKTLRADQICHISTLHYATWLWGIFNYPTKRRS